MKRFGLSVFVVLLVAGVYTLRPKESVKERILRRPASVRPRVQGKAGAAFTVEIRSLVPVVANAGDPILLEASISSRRDVEQVEFAWNLPEGVVTQTSLTGSLGSLKAGEVRTLTLQATSQSALNKQIHLHVYKTVVGDRIGVTAQYNTRDELIIEKRMQTKAEWLEQRAAESGARLKIVQ